MQIKVFKAPTMKEAMEHVKEELGIDAVILHTKKYKEGGFLGYGSKEIVEVTAAVEEKSSKPKEKKDTGTKAKTAAPVLPNTVLSQYKTHGTETGVEMAAKSAELGAVPEAPIIQKPEFPSFGTDPLAAANPAGTVGKPSLGKDFYDSLLKEVEQSPPQKPRIWKAESFSAPASKELAEEKQSAGSLEEESKDSEENFESETDLAIPEEQEKIQKLENELAQMKAMLAQMMSKGTSQNVLTLQEVLQRQGVEDAFLNEMAATLGAGETLVEAYSSEAREILTDYLQRSMNFSEGIALPSRGTRIVALIGPTGVGKTTTLAKIAARFVLEQGVSAALITADTYRISAVEQLKTYSDIIGLPLEIVYTPDELRVAIRKHEKKQLILIDTAGRSQHNEYQMDELQRLLKANSRIEKHLVISATTKDGDVADIMDKFSSCKPNRVIFTKVDETRSLGIIPNLLCGKDISLSYLAYGQSVPDDIFPASAEKLADLLLRE